MSQSPEQVAPGNIDLKTRPIAYNKDGSYSTVRTMTFEDGPGRYVNVPSVMDDGRVVGQPEAYDAYRKSGHHLGRFSALPAAIRAAENLHEDQAGMYDQMARENQPTVGPPHPMPRREAVEIGQPVINYPGHPLPQVEVGTPVLEPQQHVQVGAPQITDSGQPHHPQYAVHVGVPEIQTPANPGHHGAFMARAANVIMHGRNKRWHPQEIAAAVDHIRSLYDDGYGVE